MVTATKRTLPLDALPRSLGVEVPRADGFGPAAGTDAVAADAEGLTLTALGPGRNRMFLRGVADSPFNGPSQATVATEVNDVRLTYSAPDPDLRLVDVRRVELLKGPQGSLYGTGVLGGVYRVVTNPADPDRFDGSVSLGLAGLGHGALGGLASLVANLPLAPSAVGLRLVGYLDRQPGWIDTGARSDSNTNHVAGGRASLGIELESGWRIDLGGLSQHIETADSQYTYISGSRDRPAQLPEPHMADISQTSARAIGRIGEVDATLVLGYSWHVLHETVDATQGATDFGLPDPQLFKDLRKFTVLDGEARFAGRVGGLNWLAGLSQITSTERETRSLFGATPGSILEIDASHSLTSDTGLFADATLPLQRNLELEAGGRVFHSRLDASHFTAGILTREVTSKSGITPSVALVWRSTNSNLAWIRYGSAFRQGGLDFEAGGQTHPFLGDQLATVEVGWRRKSGSAGRIDIDAFATWWTDMQADMLLSNGLIETRNAGRARIAGVEAGLSRQFGKAWELTIGGTVQSALLVRNQLGLTLDDRRLPAIPDYTARLGLKRRFGLAGAHAAVGIEARFVGPARLSFDPRLDRPMGNILDTRLDLALDWGRSRLDLRLDNLLDRAGDSFAYGNPFRLGVQQYTPQPPLAFVASMTRHF